MELNNGGLSVTVELFCGSKGASRKEVPFLNPVQAATSYSNGLSNFAGIRHEASG